MNKIFTYALTLTAVVAVLALPAFAGITTPAGDPDTLTLLAGGLCAVAIVRWLRNK
jgi:hypothetical protein